MANKTPVESRVKILAEIWDLYRDEPIYEDFLNNGYDDFPIMLAYAYSKGFALTTDSGLREVSKGFENLLKSEGIKVSHDIGDRIEDVFAESAEANS